MIRLLWLAGDAAIPAVWGWLYGRLLLGRAQPARRVTLQAAVWAGSAAMAAAADAVAGLWPFAAACALNIAAALAWWWWHHHHRRRRRRAARFYGAKSRALIARLVRRLRDLARRRPALRPVPGL